MRKIELNITDKQYAQIMYDSVVRDSGTIEEILVREINKHSSVGTVAFDRRVRSNLLEIKRIEMFKQLMQDEKLDQFVNEIPCGDPELKKRQCVSCECIYSVVGEKEIVCPRCGSKENLVYKEEVLPLILRNLGNSSA